MQRSIITLGGVIALLPMVQGIAFGGPEPTKTVPYPVLGGWTPKPTKGPSVAELRRRQTNYFANTCGWVDRDMSSEVTCPLGDTCMLYTARNTAGMVGCCPDSDQQSCGWVSGCMDYITYMSGGCDSNCKLNRYIQKCTDFDEPFCVSWTFPNNNIKAYGCGTDSFSAFETVFQEATDTFDSSSTSISLPTVSSAVTEGQSSGTGTRSAFYSSYPTTYHSSSKTVKKVSIALVVGLVIAGLFVIGVITGLILFCCLRQKKKRQLAANQQAIAAAQASRPQTQFQAQTPNPQQQGTQQMPPPPVTHTPQPGKEGYFAQPPQDPQKFNPQTQVHEYAVSPISNPPTPAPAYQQPYMAPPPLPNAAEVDAISVPHAPSGSHGPVYEIGNGR